MRVLYAADWLRNRTTGIERYVEGLGRALAARGDIELTVLVEQPAHADRISPSIPRLIYRPPHPLQWNSATRGLFAALASPPDLSGFDVVHFPNVIPPFFRLPRGPRYVMTVHDLIPRLMPEATPRLSPPFFRHVLPRLGTRVSAFIANSEATRDDFLRFFPMPADRVHVTPLATHRRPVAVDELEEAKDDYLLAVGTVEPRKNLVRVIEAFLEVVRRRPDLPDRLVIVGRPGWSRGEIEAAMRRAGGRVDAAGYVDDERLERLYREAKALVYPSLYEGFGLPVLEAMGWGCPVITSRVSSLPEVGGDAAIYVDPTSVDQIAEAMVRLLDDAPLRNDLMRRGLARAGLFSWERCAAETVRVYERVLREGRSA